MIRFSVQRVQGVTEVHRFSVQRMQGVTEVIRFSAQTKVTPCTCWPADRPKVTRGREGQRIARHQHGSHDKME